MVLQSLLVGLYKNSVKANIKQVWFQMIVIFVQKDSIALLIFINVKNFVQNKKFYNMILLKNLQIKNFKEFFLIRYIFKKF